VNFTNIQAGTYRLIETQAPSGFKLSDPIEITIAYDENGQLVVTKPEAWDGTIVNQQIIDLPITKINEAGEVLSGASFVLQNADGQVIQGPVTTDYEGKALFTALTQGTYYLVETQAPAGYELLKNPIKISIDYDTSGKLAVLSPDNWNGDVTNKKTETPTLPDSSEEPGSSSSSEESSSSSNGSGSSTSTSDSKEGSLLQTGDTTSSFYFALGIVLILSSFYLLEKKRR